MSKLKRAWVGAAAAVALDDAKAVLEQAVQVKNVGVPCGVHLRLAGCPPIRGA